MGTFELIWMVMMGGAVLLTFLAASLVGRVEDGIEEILRARAREEAKLDACRRLLADGWEDKLPN